MSGKEENLSIYDILHKKAEVLIAEMLLLSRYQMRK